jgi:hypothetical protein
MTIKLYVPPAAPASHRRRPVTRTRDVIITDHPHVATLRGWPAAEMAVVAPDRVETPEPPHYGQFLRNLAMHIQVTSGTALGRGRGRRLRIVIAEVVSLSIAAAIFGGVVVLTVLSDRH